MKNLLILLLPLSVFCIESGEAAIPDESVPSYRERRESSEGSLEFGDLNDEHYEEHHDEHEHDDFDDEGHHEFDDFDDDYWYDDDEGEDL